MLSALGAEGSGGLGAARKAMFDKAGVDAGQFQHFELKGCESRKSS